MMLLLWLGGAALVVALGAIVWSLLHPDRPVEPAHPVPPVLTPVDAPLRQPVDTRFAPAESASAPVGPPPVPSGLRGPEKPSAH